MKKILLVFGLGFFGLTLTSCAKMMTKAIVNDLFKDADSNKNESISQSEFSVWSAKAKDAKKKANEKGMSVEEYSKFRFNEIDSNKDAKITREEFMEAIIAEVEN